MKSGTLRLLSGGVAVISNWTHYNGGDIVILHPDPGAGNEVALFYHLLISAGLFRGFWPSLLRNIPVAARTFANLVLTRGIHVCYTICRIRRPNGGFR